MSFVNYETRDIQLKVVLYGPAGSGKSSALQYVYAQTNATPPNEKQNIRLPAPPGPGQACYDMLPLKLGDIRGFSTHLNLWTVPGAAGLREARRSVLGSVDGIVFIADSRPTRMRANHLSMEELAEGLRSHAFDPARLPFVLACAHADAPDARPPHEVAKVLLQAHPQAASVPVVAVNAIRGEGVFEAVKMITKQVLSELKRSNAR